MYLFFYLKSIAGLKVVDPDLVPGTKYYTNVYSPSKFGVTALSDVLAKELRGGKIRVTVRYKKNIYFIKTNNNSNKSITFDFIILCISFRTSVRDTLKPT